MNITLWVIQCLLAAMFAMAGLMKSTQPIDKLVKTVTWANRFSLTTVRLIGIAELMGALGLIFPWWLKVAPILTPVAASALAFIQLLAIIHHAKHNEGKAILFNIVILAMASCVAYGRFS